MKKIRIAMIMAMVLVLTVITACSKQATPPSGTLILKVNPSIAIHYDAQGSVDSLEALNQDALPILADMTNYKNKDAKDVTAQLVQIIAQHGYLVDDIEQTNRKITIELDDDSYIPSDAFVNDVAQSIKDFLNSEAYKNKIQYMDKDQKNYVDFTDYDVSDYLDDKYETDYDDTDYDQKPAPQPAQKPVQKPAQKPTNKPVNKVDDTDYDDTDYDDVTDYDDTDYDDSDYDDTDYDDTDYDDVTDYDDTDYDDTDYDD